MNNGGKREGAGRKPVLEKRVKRTVTVLPSKLDKLKEQGYSTLQEYINKHINN